MFSNTQTRRQSVVWLMAAFSALVVYMLATTVAVAQGKQNFTLINHTGYTISEVYVSPSKSDSWDEDVMEEDVLPNNAKVDIAFSRKEKACLWDLKVVYDDGESAEWENFNLCEVSSIAISYSRKTGETWATYE